MGNSRASIGYIAANEPTGDKGTNCLKGMEKLAREDEERALWLDEQLVEQRVESRRVRAKARMAKFRKRTVLA